MNYYYLLYVYMQKIGPPNFQRPYTHCKLKKLM